MIFETLIYSVLADKSKLLALEKLFCKMAFQMCGMTELTVPY